jgi:hypothetical protein
MKRKSQKAGPAGTESLADDGGAVVRQVVEKYGGRKRAVIQIL